MTLPVLLHSGSDAARLGAPARRPPDPAEARRLLARAEHSA
jgi:hypothetical protein